MHTIKEIFTSASDDIARGIIGAVGSDAAQTSAQIGLSSLGLAASLVGFAYDDTILSKYRENIDNSLMTYNRIDLKIAGEYTKLHPGNTLSHLNTEQNATLNNIVEAMRRNGAVKLFTQKVIRDIGTAGGLIGGPGGGLAVLGIMKSMENNDDVPTPEKVEEEIKGLNSSGGMALSIGLLGYMFPPSLIFTVPAIISANVALSALRTHVSEWHEKLGTENGRCNLLYEFGVKSLESQKRFSNEFEIKNLRGYQLKLVENSVARVAKGYGKHTANDIMILSQFATSVDRWFPEPKGEVLIDKYLHVSAKKLANTIKKAQILDHKEDLISFARKAESEGLSI